MKTIAQKTLIYILSLPSVIKAFYTKKDTSYKKDILYIYIWSNQKNSDIFQKIKFCIQTKIIIIKKNKGLKIKQSVQNFGRVKLYFSSNGCSKTGIMFKLFILLKVSKITSCLSSLLDNFLISILMLFNKYITSSSKI